MRHLGFSIACLSIVSCGEQFAVSDAGQGGAAATSTSATTSQTSSSTESGSAVSATSSNATTSAGTGGAGGEASSSTGRGGAGPSSAESSSSTASGGNSGAGGNNMPADCELITGAVAFGGHCYVDITAASVNANQADTDCGNVGDALGLKTHSVTISDVAELDFVANTFGAPYANQQDIWIGYTCDSVAHPMLSACNCSGPCADSVAQAVANQSWDWVDETPNGFVNWATANPKGTGRCAALSKLSGSWSWADRDCLGTSFVAGQLLLTYRTVCEWP